VTLSPGDPNSSEVWVQTLDALEGHVEVVEAWHPTTDGEPDVLMTSLCDWAPPVGMGPIPEELRSRATHLLQRQLDVAEDLVQRISFSKQQREVTARMSTSGRPVAAFFDQSL
jgi:hypothetical protein